MRNREAMRKDKMVLLTHAEPVQENVIFGVFFSTEGSSLVSLPDKIHLYCYR